MGTEKDTIIDWSSKVDVLFAPGVSVVVWTAAPRVVVVVRAGS